MPHEIHAARRALSDLRDAARLRLLAKLFPEVDDRLNRRAALVSALARCAVNGRVFAVESGRDCDGVVYSGRVHEIDASVEAYYALDSLIAKWADGPFSLRIASPTETVEYTSRDLGLEAFENGHAHCLTA